MGFARWILGRRREFNRPVRRGRCRGMANTNELIVAIESARARGNNVKSIRKQKHDPGSFYKPWTARRHYRRIDQDYQEKICAENNTNIFDYHIPVADKPDF